MKKEMAGVGNEAGIVSVVFGIISIVIASGVGIIFGVVGLLFGMRQHKRNPTKWSKAGMITWWNFAVSPSWRSIYLTETFAGRRVP
jgi:hypothetical protein